MKKNTVDLMWEMFKESGNPAYYVLFKRLNEEEAE